MFGAIQMVEYNPDLTDQVVTALYKFVNLANTMLHNNGEGVEAWTQTRWEDFVITLQWCVSLHCSVDRSSWSLSGCMISIQMGMRIFWSILWSNSSIQVCLGRKYLNLKWVSTLPYKNYSWSISMKYFPTTASQCSIWDADARLNPWHRSGRSPKPTGICFVGMWCSLQDSQST